jgi:hypothetical protein
LPAAIRCPPLSAAAGAAFCGRGVALAFDFALLGIGVWQRAPVRSFPWAGPLGLRWGLPGASRGWM